MQNIVLDTNCLIQVIPLRSKYHSVWQAFRNEGFALCVSTAILDEYHEILSRLSNTKLADNILATITNSPNTIFVNPTFRFGIIKADPDDNKFVDCAIVSNAEYIVSDDRHFDEVRLCKFPRIDILTLDEFARLTASI